MNRLRAALANPKVWAALAVIASACGVAISPELRDALLTIAIELLR